MSREAHWVWCFTRRLRLWLLGFCGACFLLEGCHEGLASDGAELLPLVRSGLEEFVGGGLELSGAAKMEGGKTIRILDASRAKLLGVVPEGWRIEVLEGVAAETCRVPLATGKEGVFRVKPFAVVPEPVGVGGVIFKEMEAQSSGKDGEGCVVGALSGVLIAYLEEAKGFDRKLTQAIDALEVLLEAKTVKKGRK